LLSKIGGQSACSTLFSSAVSVNFCLRIIIERTGLVRRIEVSRLLSAHSPPITHHLSRQASLGSPLSALCSMHYKKLDGLRFAFSNATQSSIAQQCRLNHRLTFTSALRSAALLLYRSVLYALKKVSRNNIL
jgi:hypothetical protein